MAITALSPHRSPASPPSIPLVRVRPMHDSAELDRLLRQLIVEILALPPKTVQWQRQANIFARHVQRSGKLWGAPGVSRELYTDVLSGVWIYVLRNFHNYDPNRGAVMTWINNRLKWDLKTSQGKFWEELRWRLLDYPSGETDANSWIDRLQASEDGSILLQEIGQRWRDVQAAATAIHVTGRPNINCYELFQDKLGLSLELETWLKPRDRDTYRAMSEYYEAPLPTIACFWTNKCLPFIKDVYSDFNFDDFT
jgi:hypothetical protein